MKLQIALDDIPMERALALLERVRDWVDIIEIGTPFLYRYGLEAVRAAKERFPEKEVLADMKITDAGAYETEEALDAGADYVTVLAVTDDLTIRACVEAANARGREIVADMICVTDMEARVAQLEALGVHGLAVHTGIDQQAAGCTPLDDLKRMSACARRAKISVAGGIKPSTIPDYAAHNPAVLIVGGGICHADDPAAAAREIYEAIHGTNGGR